MASSASSIASERLTSTATDLHDFLRKRRSVRRFKTDLVPVAAFERILSTSTFAPSAHHRQPWRFAYLSDAASKTKLADAMARDFERDMISDGLAPDEIGRRLSRSRERLLDAPLIVMLSVDTSELDSYEDEARQQSEYLMAVQSVASAGLQMMLAAHAEGIGSVWVCSPLFAQDAVRRALELPASWQPQFMIFLGFPADVPAARPRKSIDEISKLV